MPINVPQHIKLDKTALVRIKLYLEFVAIALLGTFILWKGVWAGWNKLGSDFPQYYLGAKLVAEHYSLDRFYDWIWLQRIANHFGVHHELVGFSGLTPFSTFPLLPLVWLEVMQAKHVWVLLNIGILVATVHVLSKTCGLTARKTWLIALLAVIPLRNDLALGQMHLLVFALLVLGWRFHLRGKQVAGGCCIALAGALKIYPLFYCFYFLVKKRWNALGAAVATTVACGVASLVLFGKTATNVFLWRQLPRLLNGEALNPYLTSSTSTAAMFHGLFLFEPEWNPHPLVSSPLLYATFYALWQALLAATVVSQIRRRFEPDERESVEWCAFLTLLMFLSSTPETYHFVVLIGAAVPTYAILKKLRPRLSWLYLALYAIACNARNIVPHGSDPAALTGVLIPKLWAGVGLIVLYAVVLSSTPTLSASSNESVSGFPGRIGGRFHRQFGVFTIFGILLPALWLIGFASSLRHLKSMDLNHSRQIIEADGAWMRTEPQDTAQGLYYVAMLDTGYRVLRDGVPVDDIPGDDELSYAVDREGRTLWIEIVTNAGPAIRESSSNNDGHAGCEISNAEFPALSQDGSSLAFIREESGRGSLWIADSHHCVIPDELLRVTPPDIDVRAVNGAPGGSFVFSAMTVQGPTVFRVSRGTAPETLLRPGANSDAIAISGDGDTILLSETVRDHWQLISESLSTHIVRQLTAGGCNSTDPSWTNGKTLIYATDCGRAMGWTKLAEIEQDQ
jgi:hypothetical protein